MCIRDRFLSALLNYDRLFRKYVKYLFVGMKLMCILFMIVDYIFKSGISVKLDLVRCE